KQISQGDRTDGVTDEADVPVHEDGVAASAMEAEWLVIDTAVVGRPGTAGRAAERQRIVVDHAQPWITVLCTRRPGDPVARVRLRPAPGIAKRGPGRKQIHADWIGI